MTTDLCPYKIEGLLGADGDRWVCGLSADHEGDHYLMRPAPVGRITPIAPDSARDKRRDGWRARERARAARYLDEWFRVLDAAGSSLVPLAESLVPLAESLVPLADLLECLSAYAALVEGQRGRVVTGDDGTRYVLTDAARRLQGWGDVADSESGLQQNADYGASLDTEDATVLPSSLHQDDGGK